MTGEDNFYLEPLVTDNWPQVRHAAEQGGRHNSESDLDRLFRLEHCLTDGLVAPPPLPLLIEDNSVAQLADHPSQLPSNAAADTAASPATLVGSDAGIGGSCFVGAYSSPQQLYDDKGAVCADNVVGTTVYVYDITPPAAAEGTAAAPMTTNGDYVCNEAIYEDDTSGLFRPVTLDEISRPVTLDDCVQHDVQILTTGRREGGLGTHCLVCVCV